MNSSNETKVESIFKEKDTRLATSQVLFRIILIVFVVEFLVMLLLQIINLNLEPLTEAVVDALILSLLSFPLLYIWVIHPFVMSEKRATQNLIDYKYAIDQHSILAITDVEGTIIDANDLFCEISEYSKEELMGKNHRILNSGNQNKDYWKSMYRDLAKGFIWKDQVLNKAKSGRLYWVDTTIVPIMDKKHKPKKYIAVRTDLSLQKKILDKIEKYHSSI